ncbi:exopolyphosphatase PRUNE1 [Protopterus annectens]|uniref:exopolyphosphatase PRUNE1 n=1 Tax=Protopterus annectens TaxID=7888 RepID=UPI001CFB5EC3|nr:exopolyphosphatase PRUNE1 [Protopterus annectens]
MNQFLERCKNALENEHDDARVHVVLGNEACDLDSVVSAITLAYFLAKTSSEKRTVFIPLLNIHRSEFPLRTEITFFLKQNRILAENLVFRDELHLHALHNAGRLSLTLVDHNVLPSTDAVLEDVVAEVIDHRPLERKKTASCQITSELVGSCTTLITEKIMQEDPEILDIQLATLLHGTIVLDCINMAPEAGKVTQKDTDIVSRLEARFPELQPRHSIFEALQSAKFDVSGLTTEQMLRKDLKALSGGDISVAISAVYVKLEVFLKRPALQKEIGEFCQKHGYNILIAMTIAFNENNEPFREIAVYSRYTDIRDCVCKYLEKATNPHLRLTSVQSTHPAIRAYHQGNTQASRKKVLPIIKDFLKDRENSVTPGVGQAGISEDSGTCEDLQLGAEEQLISSEDIGVISEVEERLRDVGEVTDLFDVTEVGFEEDVDQRESCTASCRDQPEYVAADEDFQLPPTPMNSLVEGCPLDNGLPKLTAEAFLERFSKIVVDAENTAAGKKVKSETSES